MFKGVLSVDDGADGDYNRRQVKACLNVSDFILAGLLQRLFAFKALITGFFCKRFLYLPRGSKVFVGAVGEL
ncbi:MAG: hypothetical protein KAG18_07015 [Sinobacterium sp.]|nr:hypothetical protein [Sinobacterium sp.]